MPARPSFLVLAAMLAGVLPAQSSLLQTVEIPFGLQSGVIRNPTAVAATVWSRPLSFAATSSYRVRFGRVELNDPRDAVIVTNVLDGQVQRLDRDALGRWQHMSGWFNGDAAIVGLDLAPGSTGSVEVTDAVTFPAAPPGEDDLCEGDTRVPSSDTRICRLLIPGGDGGVGICTGFLINDRATYLTGGRCYAGLTNPTTVAEFNVPASTAAGAIVHPFLNDQFPGDPTALQFHSDPPENDWAVGRLHPNSFGQNASLVNGFFGSFLPGTLNQFDGRVTGYGADTTPLSRNFTQQTDTGLVDLPFFGSELHHHSDTQAGSAGSPLIVASTQQIAGIHCEGGCNGAIIPLFPLPHNSATAINTSSLQTAITSVGGCAGLHLSPDDSAQASCSPVIYSLNPDEGHWNIVGVSSPADWDILRESIGSSFNGNVCDFLLSNGTLGPIPPISGEIRRVAAFSPATVQCVSATPLPLDETTAATWSASRILRAFEFFLPLAPQTLNVTVAGDPSLRWHLYRPDAASGPAWSARTSGLLSAGIVGGSTVSNIAATAAGTYCLVVYRDGGADILDVPSLAVTVGTSNNAPLALTSNTPTAIGAGVRPFSVTPVAGAWNVVGVSALASDDYDLSLGTGVSATPGSAAEFVVANGQSGTITRTAGVVAATPGSQNATIEQVQPVAAPIGALVASSVPAGHVLKAFEFTVTTSGSHQIVATGSTALRWALFAPTSGTEWRGPAEARDHGQVGGSVGNSNLAAGNYVIVIARDGGVAATETTFNLRITPASTLLTLTGPGSSVGNLTNPDYGFTCVPTPVRWNAVGSFGVLVASQTVMMGAASSNTSLGTAFVIANGHLGQIAPAAGLITHSGLAAGNLFQANGSVLNVNASASTSWATSTSLHLFEFHVLTVGTYNLNVTGPTGLGWMLFRPGTSPSWRSRSDGEFLSAVGTAVNGVTLQTGTHVIAVARSGTTPPSGTVTCSVSFVGNPAPTLSSVTPSSVVGGIASSTLIITGSNILSGCVAEWDGTITQGLIGTFGFVTGSVPAAVLAVPGTHTLRLLNPPPAAGPSATLPFVVRPPRITQVSPPSIPVIPPGGAGVQLTITGVDFLAGAVVHAGGRVLPTTFVNSGQLVATIGASVAETNTAGAVALTIENGHTAQSNTLALQVGPGGTNRGTIVRYPLDPFPGEPYAAILEGGPPGGLFTWMIDPANPTPVAAWPSPAVNLVLGVNTFGSTFALLDGFGLFGPANPAAVYNFDPNGTAPGGVYIVPGFFWPQNPVNLRLSLQCVHLDPAAALGFGLGWTRVEDL